MNRIHNAIHRLRGARILIGKDEQSCKLMLITIIEGKQIKCSIGQPGSVPNCVSRCQLGLDIAHCQLTIDNQERLSIANLKQQNVTYVNGMPVINSYITPDATVQLGVNLYTINIPEILLTAESAVNKVLPPVYNISHLETVWENHKETLNKLKKRQKNVALLSRSSMIFTMGGGALAALANKIGLEDAQEFLWALPVIGAIVMIISFYISAKDKSLENAEMAQDDLLERYVCPNPSCNHFVGNQPYKVLRQNKKCPYCQCKWES